MGCGSSNSKGQGSTANQNSNHQTQQQQQPQQANHSSSSSASSLNSEKKSKKKDKDDKKDGSNSNLSRVALEKETLVRYVQIEKEINQLEARNVVQLLQMQWDELKGLEEECKRLTAEYQKCKEQALKEKKDVDNMNEPTVRNFFADQNSFDSKLSKEQEEYVSALNQQEVVKKEMDSAMEQKEKAKVTVKELHLEVEKLQNLYQEQDQILTTIFDGKYGSELEYKLEREHDVTNERQQRISAARARWKAARLLVNHASSQLDYATQRWDYVMRIAPNNGQMRFGIATEVRNYLIAAAANLRNSLNYLKGIEFPYCKLDEVNTLEKATNNIFNDMTTADRHAHAMNVYSTMHQRSRALLQWFDTVINKTIEKDLQSASEQLFSKKRDLRIERVGLIKVKMTELLGADAAAQLDEDANLTDAKRLQEQLSSVNEEELKKQLQSVQIVQPEKCDVSTADETPESVGELQTTEENQTEALPLQELAPPPSQDQLFGDIDSIKKQYEIDMEEFQKAQDVNKARVQQGLQEKLAARKSRKARKLAEQQQQLLQESASA